MIMAVKDFKKFEFMENILLKIGRIKFFQNKFDYYFKNIASIIKIP